MLIGSAGLGKTTALRWLARNSPNVVVVLRATDCTHGVIRAIQERIPGLDGDAGFLEGLVFSRGMEVYIDALNEASPEARIRVREFVNRLFKARVTLTSQLINTERGLNVQRYKLLPLKPEQIGDFLGMQWAAVCDLACRFGVTRDRYMEAVEEFVRDVSTVTEDSTDSRSKVSVLSNPMDAQVAAHLLAKGQRCPSYINLFDVVFDELKAEYTSRFNKEFPRLSLAKVICSWRSVDEAEIPFDDALNDVASMLGDYRLIVKHILSANGTASGAPEGHRWLSRHDRIMDMLMLPAFMGANKEEVWDRHIEDARFWGVYELLATRLPADAEAELYKKVNWTTATFAAVFHEGRSDSTPWEQASELSPAVDLNELRNRYEIARSHRRQALVLMNAKVRRE